MCMDTADLLLCFHLSTRCEVFKTQAAGSKQVWATLQPPNSSTLHTCVLIQSSQKPRPRRLLYAIEGGMEAQRLDNLNKVTIRKWQGPHSDSCWWNSFHYRALDRQQEHLTFLLSQLIVNSENCFYIKNKKRCQEM